MKIYNKSNNPFREQTPLSQSLIQYEGRQYTIKAYNKSYSGTDRFLKFSKWVFPTLLSLGFLLLYSKCNSNWKKIIYGEAPCKVLIPKKIVKCHIAPVKNNCESLSYSRKSTFQHNLNQSNIPLNCLTPAPLVNKNHFNNDDVQAFLNDIQRSQPDAHEKVAKLFANRDLITFGELQKALSQCTAKLKDLLGDNDYSIGFVPNKSQKWIAEMALPHLNRAPASCFQNQTDNKGSDVQQSQLRTEDKNFVIFDDASYTGKQLVMIIKKLKEQLNQTHSNTPCKLFLVVPFCSTLTLERIMKEFEFVLV